MKDSQPIMPVMNHATKYIKANNERFSTPIDSEGVDLEGTEG